MRTRHIRSLISVSVLLSAMLVALVVFSGCAQPAASPTTKKLEPASLRLDWLPFGYQAPFFLAYDKGWYADEGIALYIGDGSGSGDAVKFVGTGKDTFGYAQGTELVRGVAAGVPAKMVALLQRKNATAFIYHEGLGIQKPKDLEGKTMGGSPEDLDDPAIKAFAAANGLDFKKVTVKTVGPPLKLTLLGQKQYDFIETHMTSKGQVEQQFPGVKLGRFLLPDYGLDGLVGYGLLASKTIIETKPDLVRGFVAASIKGWEAAEKNPDEALAAMKKYKPEIGYPEGLKEVMPLRDTKRTAGKSWGWQSAEDWQETIDILYKGGGIKETLKSDAVFTNDFLPKK